MNDALLRQLEARGRLATPPSVVVRLLELTANSEASAKDIADTIAMDPGLSVRVLRFVNSPMAGVRREVTSLQQAVTLLGINSVKMMALSFSVLSARPVEGCDGYDHQHIVLQSVGCGIAAKVFCEMLDRGSSQEAFVAGLLSQIGRTALAATFPDQYAPVAASARQAPRDLPALERAVFGESYAFVGAWLLRNWGIPETLCTAVETFRSVEEVPDAPALAKLLDLGELAACVICPDPKGIPYDSRAFTEAAQRHFGASPQPCMAALNRVAAEIEDTRAALQLSGGNMRSLEEIETDVRERIAELSVAMHLENQSMAANQEELMRRATTDALTKVGNRAAFDARLSLELVRAARSGESLALLMIDCDRFKTLNDTRGHQAGDRLLQSIAQVLDENVRKVDYVARYGGDEFAVIAPSTTSEGVAHLAERLRYAAESLRVSWDGKPIHITLSIGAAVFTEVADGHDTANIISAADAQLYAAKCAGRNRVEIVVEGAPTAAVERMR